MLLDCKHVHPGQTCLQYDYWKLSNVLVASLKVFFFANILPALIFRFKAFKNKPKEEITKTLKSYLRSVVFLTLACALPPIMNCYMQRLVGETGRLAGVTSQLFGVSWVAIESFQRRREIGLFLLPKAIQSIWNALSNRKVIPHIKGIETLIIILSIGLIGVASTQTGRKDGIKPMYNSLLSKLWSDD